MPSSTASELTLVSVEDENAGAYTCIANSSSRNVVNDDTAYVEVVGELMCVHAIDIPRCATIIL